MFIERVCQCLLKHQVTYAVVGGHAVALHGAVRGTVDLDLVVAWSQDNLARAAQALSELGLVSRLPLNAQDVFSHRDEYIRERNLIAWNFYNPRRLDEQVDLIINYDLHASDRVTLQTRGGPIDIITLDELIRMKRAAARPQDLLDVEALEKLPK